MRNEVISALRSLSDPEHQRTRWGRVEEGVSYYDDLTINVHLLYDDTQVLPSPDLGVPDVLHLAEVSALLAVDQALRPLMTDHGDSPDHVYLADPRWKAVTQAAAHALEVMRTCDEGKLS
jgi:hypothetical protein